MRLIPCSACAVVSLVVALVSGCGDEPPAAGATSGPDGGQDGAEPPATPGADAGAPDGGPKPRAPRAPGVGLVVDAETRGAGSQLFSGFYRLGNQQLFFADDGVHGRELYRTDGTAAGTQLVKDIWPGGMSGAGGGVLASKDAIYFDALDPTHGRELWRSDGTAAGTFLVADITPGPEGSSPSLLGVTTKGVFFLADDRVWLVPTGAATPIELASSPSNCSGGRDRAQLGEGIAFLRCTEGPGGASVSKIWVSDGTPAGTRVALELGVEPAGAFRTPVISSAGAFVYIAHGSKLYRSGGTPETTTLARDFADLGAYTPGAGTSFADGRFVFQLDGSGGQEGLWITDGTAAGTSRLLAGSFSVKGAPLNGRILADRGFARGVVATDGSVAGTVELPIGFSGSTRDGKWLYTVASSGRSVTLARTDGVIVEPLGSYSTPSSSAVPLGFLGGSVLLACDPTPDAPTSVGIELCSIDVATQTMSLVADINPNNASSNLRDVTPTASGGVVFLVDRQQKTELWSGDPTGAKALREFDDAGRSARPNTATNGPYAWSPPLARLGSDVLFPATDANELGLWATDGTAAGTRLVAPLTEHQPISPFATARMVTSGARVFFALESTTSRDYVLWQTNGTSAQTKPVPDAKLPRSANLEVELVPYRGGVVYPTADGGFAWFDGAKVTTLTSEASFGGLEVGASTKQVFFTNTTTLQTWSGAGAPVVLVDLSASARAYTTRLIVGVSRAFLVTRDNNPRLWATDGTKAGTTDLGEWYTLPFQVDAWTMDGDTLFLAGCRERSSCGLWRSDGTPDGTRLLVPRGTDPSPPFSASGNFGGYMHLLGDGKLLFQNSDETSGVEPWLRDGASARRVADIAPAGLGSYPRPLTSGDGATYFLANDHKRGRELWWFVP